MEQGEQIVAERVDIIGEKLEMHKKNIFFGNREVACSNRYGIPGFLKGHRVETWDGQTAACMMMMAWEMR